MKWERHGNRADEDIDMIVDALEYYPNEMLRMRSQVLPDLQGSHTNILVHEPRGVVCAMLAWNFPILNVAYKVAPAIAAGCSIIIRPSIDSPVSAYLFGEICAEINFPAGVINVLTGSSKDTSIPYVREPYPKSSYHDWFECHRKETCSAVCNIYQKIRPRTRRKCSCIDFSMIVTWIKQ